MTKRRMLAIIIALVMCVSLCACSVVEAETDIQSDTGTFAVVVGEAETDIQSDTGTFAVVVEGRVNRYAYQTIMYDPDTMVMYTYLDGDHSTTMSVMYNADGTFKLYSSNTETKTFVVVTEGRVNGYAYQTIMYDPDTMVMYTYLDGDHSSTMSVMYNADGTLKFYSSDTETQ